MASVGPPLQCSSNSRPNFSAASRFAIVPVDLAIPLTLQLGALESGNPESIFALPQKLFLPVSPPTARPYQGLRCCRLHWARMRKFVDQTISPRSSMVQVEEPMGYPPVALACTAPYIHYQDWLDIGLGKGRTSPGCTGIVAPVDNTGSRGIRIDTLLTGPYDQSRRIGVCVVPQRCLEGG